MKYAQKKSAVEADKRAAFFGGMFLVLHLFFAPAFGWAQEPSNEAIFFDIPQQRADEALILFAEQAGFTFIVPFDQLEGVMANELNGLFTPEVAIEMLLSGSGLQAEISDERLAINKTVPSGGESHMDNKKRVGLFGAFVGFLGLGDVVFAQPQGEESARSRYAIEEIIVSSRRIEEGLQEAPLAVTALSGLELENRGALDVIDFADVAPNVSLKTNGAVSGFAAAPRTSIRGIGQSDFVINTDPAVGLYADGVYLGRSIGSVLDLVDVERVEALRGPQGTLFGRNSTGGAINVISKKPEVGGELYGNATAGFGEDGYLLLRGSANIPLSDTTALRVSALKRERDGFIPSLVYDNLDLGAEDVSGIKAAFRWQPNETFTLDLDTDFSTRSDSAAPIIAVHLGDLSIGETGLDNPSTGASTALDARRFNNETPSGPPIGNSAPFQTQDPLCGTDQAHRDTSPTCLGNFYASSRDGTYQTWFDSEGNIVRADDQSLDTYGYSARLTWELENLTIKTISSWRGFDSSFTNGSPAPIYVATNDNVRFDQDQSSHEINLSGAINDRIRWIAGVFYQEEDGIEIVEVRYPLTPPSAGNDPDFLPLAGIENRQIDNTSEAIYGQFSFDITDAVELTLGARRTEEEKNVEIGSTVGNFDNTTVRTGTIDASETSFLANLSWSLSDTTLMYVQFADGFRNGGFPARTPAGTTLTLEQASYEEEFVESFEWGLKAEAFDGALRANVAVFLADYTDMQINATVFDPGLAANVGTIQNVGDSEISGIEVEANYLVTDNFRIDASVGYLDTELTSINADNGQFILNAGNNLQKTITVDSDVELPHAPEFQVNVGANYSFYLANGAEIRNRVDMFYEAEQYSTIGNYDTELIPSTTRFNYVASYLPASEKWEGSLGIRNLTDEEDILNASLDPSPRAGVYNVLSRGREAYLQFKYNFGE